jgi:Flp pilus assembly protein TadD
MYFDVRGSWPMNDAQRIDTILRAAAAALLVAVIGFAGWFGYTVYRDRIAAENAVPAIRMYKTLQGQVAISPNDAFLRVRLGEAYGAAGKTQQAIEQFNAALKISPKHTGALMDLGIVAMQNKRYDEAKSYFQQVVDLTGQEQMSGANERREGALYNLGVLAFQQKNYEEAIGFFKSALRIRRDASDTYMYLAQSLDAIGQGKDAEAAVGTALQFDPNFAQAHYLMGKLLLADGQKVRASAEVGRARELAPDAPEPKALADQIGDPAKLFAQATAQAKSDPEAAAEAATIAFNLDRKNNVPAGKLAGKLLLAQGNKAGALDVYNRAAQVAPGDAEIAAAIKALTVKKKAATKKP